MSSDTLRDQHEHAARLVELCRLVPWGAGNPLERAMMCVLDAADLSTETYLAMAGDLKTLCRAANAAEVAA